LVKAKWLIDWCLTPTLVVFLVHLYCGVNKFYELISLTKF
jgi:hypothetical protein